MRAIFQTVSAVALGFSSLGLTTTAQADRLWLSYSDGYYSDPAYSISYRHGADCYAPYYRSPRHQHHGKHHKHSKHHKRHAYRGHDRHEHGARHSHRDDHHSNYGGHRKHQRDQRAGHRGGGHSKRTHTAYARH